MPLIILKWKNRLEKPQNLHTIHENFTRNLQVTRAKFSTFLAQNSDNPTCNTLALYLWSCSISWFQSDYRNGDQCRPVGLCIFV